MKDALIWLSVLIGLSPAFTPESSPAASIQTSETLQSVILDHSSKNDVIMFGGKHGTYRADNDFVAQLLPGLRQRGYEYLALEFEKNPRKDSLHEAVQRYAHGTLTREDMPVAWISREERYCAGTFDLIDAARKLGMKIVCYDADEGEYNSWEEREKVSFENLTELIFKKDPTAKAVIFCGASHINEEPHKDISADVRKGLQGNMEYLGCYIHHWCKGKNFTVSLLGDSIPKMIAPYCDMVVDLAANTYRCSSQLRCLETTPPERGERH
jgi:hypothetical protein